MKFFANVLSRFGMYQHMRRKNAKALVTYEKAFRGGSDNLNALAGYGLLLIRDGQFEKARDVLEEARERVKDKKFKKKKQDQMSVRIPQNLGLAYWKLGEIEKAVGIYEAVFRKYPNGMFYETLGFLLIEQGDLTGDYQKALEFNLRALDYDDNAVILDNLGQVYLRMGEYDKAEELFTRALEEKPTQFDSLVSMAKCALRRGEKEEALVYLERALKQPFSHLNTVSRDEAEALAAALHKEQSEDSYHE